MFPNISGWFFDICVSENEGAISFAVTTQNQSEKEK